VTIKARVDLPQVTLCAVSSVNAAATIRALEFSLKEINVATCKFFTDCPITFDHPAITIVPIAPITSSRAYSDFILTRLVDHVETSHCLVAQWDGHVLDASRWHSEFFDYDYIGASWPQFADGYDVGNGGFSLRSRRLMELCRDPAFQPSHPEDVAIARINRDFLQRNGMRFAPSVLADQFAAERAGNIMASFGYHGAWLMPHAVGVEAFWTLYRELDDRSSIRHDFFTILKQIRQGRRGWMRALRLMLDQLRR
jgi:hypothetical protein